MSHEDRSRNRYDFIGGSYSSIRCEDPRLRQKIYAEIGSASRVANVGAGTGSYEIPNILLFAVEPSWSMISQRPAGKAPVIQAVAEHLPFQDQEFDVATALWTVHHWMRPSVGVHELRRVARKAILVVGSTVLNEMWLTRDYFPGMSRARRPEIQPAKLAEYLGGQVRVEVLMVPCDCEDGFGEAYWARPEAYLSARVRAGTSAFSLLSQAEVEHGLRRLKYDLDSGRWDQRNGHLRDLSEYDCGLRMVVSD